MPLRIRNATYLLEEIHGLRLALQQINVPYKAELYNTLRGVQWPHDLSTVPGLWQYPLTFEFLSLTILNLGVQDAALWLIPILAATLSDAPLRRILITHCASWDECLQPFPFEALDEQLGSRPQAKLLIGWATDDAESDEFVNVFKTRLPIANSLGKVGILYSDGPRCKSHTSCCVTANLFFHLPSCPST
jgi:hypothetical protein